MVRGELMERVVYLIAESLRHADIAARIDYGWSRLAEGWVRPDGVIVRYVSSREALLSLSRKTVLLTGPGWWRSDALKDGGLRPADLTARLKVLPADGALP